MDRSYERSTLLLNPDLADMSGPVSELGSCNE